MRKLIKFGPHKFFKHKMSLLNNISTEDENFLKRFLKDFYHQVIKIEPCIKFEGILMEWTQDYFSNNEKNPKVILKLMENHEESENWFSSLIGFFYDHGIGLNDNDENYI